MNILRQKIENKEIVLGTLVSLTDPCLCEIMGNAGYDCVWIDMEHTYMSYKEVLCHLNAANSSGIPVTVLNPNQRQRLDIMIANAEKMGYSIHEMLTLASIIQLESGIDTKEMPNVSAVFHNRLKAPGSFPKLGSSPTIYYDKTMNGDGRYDTQNVADGLPPGPVCSSGEAAIKAAFLPTENFSYTYFVTDSDGKFYYNSSASGHSSTIKKLQSQGKWIYEFY